MAGLSLKTKFLALLFGLIVLLGGALTWFIQVTVSRQLIDGLSQFGLTIARDVAFNSSTLLLTRNRFALESLAAEHLEQFPEMEYVFFTTPQGTVMAHSFGVQFPDALLAPPFTTVREERILPLETERGPIFHVMTPVLAGDGGMVHLGIQGQPLRERMTATVKTLLLTTGGVLVLGMGMGWLFVGRLTRSLGTLVQVAGAVSRGDLEQRTAIASRDEVGLLATTFDQMTEQLHHSREDLLSLNRSLSHSLADVEERTRDLSQANKDLQDFVYFVSHDLRSPLLSIQGFMEEMRLDLEDLGDVLCLGQEPPPDLAIPETHAQIQTLLEERIPEDMEFVLAATVKMSRLINAILQLSRLGRLTLQPQRVAVRAVVEQNLAAMAHVIRQENITVDVGPLPEIASDLHALEQIFANLLANAVKYRHAERPCVITLWGESEATGTVTYGIKDNGRGIAEKDIPRIFGMFQRVGTQNTPGEGMGLAYTQTLVKRLGGRLTCRSILGQETTFLVTLPNLPDTNQSHEGAETQ